MKVGRGASPCKKMMKTYQNTFESLGDPLPTEAESAREYAKGFLPCFVEDGGACTG